MNRKKLPILFIVFALCSLVVVSCKRTSEDKYKNDPSMGYFPIKVGHFVVYNVDSVIYNDFLGLEIDHHYQMRYLIADTFTDNAGRLSYRVETSIRTYDTVPWKTAQVHYFTSDGSKLEYVENTLRFIKHVYPIEEGKTWKGNAMIDPNDQSLSYFADWNYKYLNVAKDYNRDSINFSNTVTITQCDEQQNDPDLLPAAYSYKTFSKEVYAFDIGMVYKELTHWTYDPPVPPSTQKTYRKGYKVVLRAIEHN